MTPCKSDCRAKVTTSAKMAPWKSDDSCNSDSVHLWTVSLIETHSQSKKADDVTWWKIFHVHLWKLCITMTHPAGTGTSLIKCFVRLCHWNRKTQKYHYCIEGILIEKLRLYKKCKFDKLFITKYKKIKRISKASYNFQHRTCKTFYSVIKKTLS